MPDSSSSATSAHAQSRKISIQERSVQVGTRIVVNGYRVNRASLKARFAEGGYQAQETAHFLLLTRELAPSTILVHWFAPDTPLSAIQTAMREELAPFEPLQQTEELQALLGGIVDSFQIEDIPLYDRSVKVGDLTVMGGLGLDRQRLKQRFLNSDYRVQETPHFLLCQHDIAPVPYPHSLVCPKRSPYHDFTPSGGRTEALWVSSQQ